MYWFELLVYCIEITFIEFFMLLVLLVVDYYSAGSLSEQNKKNGYTLPPPSVNEYQQSLMDKLYEMILVMT